MLNKKKFAFVAFYPVLPNSTGSSEVSSSFFKYWPNKNKKFFFISHLKKNYNNKYYKTIKIKKEKPFYKILSLFKISTCIIKFLKRSKHPYLIIEGPSWILYSYIVIKFVKFFLPKTKVIYHSHSIEFEIRKKFNNIFIAWLTFIIERVILKNTDIFTSVSNYECRKIFKIYKTKTIILKNGIDLEYFKNIPKQKKYKFILYSGSYNYKPNKEAIDILVDNIMPKLILKYPNLKLLITGGGYSNPKNEKWIINKGTVSKAELLYYLKNCEGLVVPLKYGSGTRIKIIEALCMGKPVISTPIGIEGIDYNKNDITPMVSKNINRFPQLIEKIITNKKYSKHAFAKKNYYRKKFSMKILCKSFYKKNIN